MPAFVALAAAALAGLYLADAGGVTWQVISCWVTVAGFCSAMAYYSFRASRLLHRDDPERRFWTAFAAAGVIFAVGDLAQVVTAVLAPHSAAAQTGTGVARTVALGLGGLLLTVMVLTYRLPHRTARERLCYLLDLATVVTAAGAYGAYWTVAGDAGDLAGVAAGPVTAMATAFTVGRLYLSGIAPFRWHIGIVGPFAAGVEALSRALGPQLAQGGRPGVVFAMTLCSHALLMGGAWLQHHRGRSGGAVRPRPRKRPYSLLPYGALGATYVLLVVSLVVNGLDLRAWIILAGALGCTGTVVGRQLASFIDNAQLLEERDALAARLHRMAFTDSLTGLGNRAMFLERVAEALGTGRPEGIGMLLIDLDDFKPVNDRYGHAAGDTVLVETAGRLRTALRPEDVVARLGGDEFAVLLCEPPAEGLPAVAERVVRAVGAPHALAGGALVAVRASVGVAVARAGDVPTVLLDRADQAMYRAKDAGKGAYALAVEN